MVWGQDHRAARSAGPRCAPWAASMPAADCILTVRTPRDVLRLPVGPGQSVRGALDATHVRVRSGCGGVGSCGTCVVRVVSGAVSAPSLADQRRLTAAERAQGRRLACQLRLEGDAEIYVDDPAPASPWRSIPPSELSPVSPVTAPAAALPLGVAVDVGTTNLRVSLWHRHERRRIAARQGQNPQAGFGADVLARLALARDDPDRGRELSSVCVAALVEAIRDMLVRDADGADAASGIGRVVVVGNTAMLSLLAGEGAGALLEPASWQRPIDFQPRDASPLRFDLGLPDAEVLLVPPLGGFVGSDLAADLLATRLVETSGLALLLDLGTNTELALWDGQVLRVSSVAGGPAFEGGVTRGMPASLGAIWKVEATDHGALECRVKGDGEPRGFCGTGLLDAVALLLSSGRLRPSGRFVVPRSGEPLAVRAGDPRTGITGADVDALQRAKAATSAAAQVLLAAAGARWRDVDRLCVCGSFGATLDVGHAQAVGLLPPIARERFEVCGGAALAGCEQLLLADDPLGLIASAAPAPVTVNMARVDVYGDHFMEALHLRPIPL